LKKKIGAKYKQLHKPPQSALLAHIPAFGSNRREMLTTLAAAKGFKRRF
jgi:hypothetical protein